MAVSAWRSHIQAVDAEPGQWDILQRFAEIAERRAHAARQNYFLLHDFNHLIFHRS